MTKILFIAPHLNPFEKPFGGEAQRTNLLLKSCARIMETDVVVFQENVVSNIENANVIYSRSVNLNKQSHPSGRFRKWKFLLKCYLPESIFPVNKEKASVINSILKYNKEYDFIVVRYISKAMECGVLQYANRLLIDVDDMPEDEFGIFAESAGSLSGKIRYRIMQKLAHFHTRKILRKIKSSYFANPVQVRVKNGIFLPNIPYYQEYTCVPIDEIKPEKRIFFIGDLGYMPNYQGVDRFLENVFKPLQKRMDNVHFYIAGKINHPDLKEKWLKFPNVHLIGYVDDIKKEYEQSMVVVVPVYHGAGTNIKILESMLMNRTCVVSEFSTRGYNEVFQDGTDYLVARNDKEYIEKLSIVLNNMELNKQIASNGYHKVKKYYSFDTFLTAVKEGFK
jgi:glycosyltransferase involved in cell wall biosynthesis